MSPLHTILEFARTFGSEEQNFFLNILDFFQTYFLTSHNLKYAPNQKIV